MGESGGRVQAQQPAVEPQNQRGLGQPARGKAAPGVVTAALQAHGAPLQPDVRRDFEHRLGHNFGAVRVHTGNAAERATTALDASGFTLGRNVVLGGGVSDQTSPADRRILAHELRHVVQQARFLDGELADAPVLDASHPSEHEARSQTGPLTPLAAPAVQLGPLDLVDEPLDLVKVAKHFVVDLTKRNWRSMIQAATDTNKDVLYVLRETTPEFVVPKGYAEALEAGTPGLTESEGVAEERWVTNIFRKAGKTELETAIADRFKDYRTASRGLGKRLYADVYTFDKGSETAETVEGEVRGGLEKMGERLSWDNTQQRLGRSGQGIPAPNDQEIQVVDEAGQVTIKHPPQNIPPRRGDVSTTQKAKLKAAEDAGGTAEQGAKEGTAEATEQTEAKAAQAVKKVKKVKPPTKPAAKAKTKAKAKAKPKPKAKPPAEAEKPPAPSSEAGEAGAQGTEQTEAKAGQTVKKTRKPPAKRATKPEPKAAEPEPKPPEQAEAPPIEEKPPAPTGQAGEAGGDVTERATTKVTTEAAGATKTVAAEVTDEATALAAKRSAQIAAEAAAGTLTAGIAGTVMEVLSNPALGFGYMVLEGISEDYQAAWAAIRAPARVRGFAQGMAARFAGLDGHAALMMITPDYVNKANIGADIVGGEGMEEQALVDGAREGWKYANGYSAERRKRELDRAAARLAAQGGPELEYDVDGQIMRESLRNVALMFHPQARNAIARWDALREERDRKEKAARLRELSKYDMTGVMGAVANALDPETE
jgi:hypothetical protein